ncbi:ERG8 [Candida pseudojiufengensis]|uniref:ERG8 n=1 Tax=Candida pseudojiufengensis TaxID=497109 RepID=UPI00222454AE|nr:ERG8 [Candida pseudojiufengensis]KAI5965764.1 ERG8 [Candida pseudojiufengensis]
MSQAFSAPGKALLAGGYLVLDPIYDAYVIALSSRMHAVLESQPTQNYSSIVVKSPQFDGEWEYLESTEINNKKNPFVQASITTILSYVRPTTNYNLHITIYSDPEYHSNEGTIIKKSYNGKKSFHYHNTQINEVPKTGLGSSAGLVAVLVTSLMSFFKPGSSIEILHNLSQIAHCLAQQKIGSGFDVAAAIYGSIKYRRFQPDIVNKVLESDLEPNLLKSTVESKWDFVHESCALPAEVKLLMGDVNGGSETPKMVSKILQWKKDKPEESEIIYNSLKEANTSFIKAVTEVNLEDIKKSLLQIRKGLRDLTLKANVPVEPIEQAQLLDRLSELRGCLGGTVPGAGGYDAIAILVLADSEKDIRKETSINSEKYNNVNWLNIHEEADGIKIENAEDYIGL